MRTGLKYQRENAGKTQAQLGDVLNITASQFGKIERGILRLTLEDAIALAKELGCRPEDLA